MRRLHQCQHSCWGRRGGGDAGVAEAASKLGTARRCRGGGVVMETAAGGHRQPHGAAGRKGKCVRGEEETTSLSTAASLEARRAMWQYCGAAVVEAATNQATVRFLHAEADSKL
jgi:hypothetical protein